MMNPRTFRLLAGLAVILVLAAPAAGWAVPLDAAQSAAATHSTALFDEVWQTVADMAFSTGVPAGHGHDYGVNPVNAWVSIDRPPGWTAEKTDQLRKILTDQ